MRAPFDLASDIAGNGSRPNALPTVVAFLRPSLLAELKNLFPCEEQLSVATTWQELESVMEATCTNLVIIDPTANGPGTMESADALIRQFPYVTFWLFSTRCPEDIRAAMQLFRAGVRDFFLEGTNELGTSIRARLSDSSPERLACEFLDDIRPVLIRLPNRLRQTIEDLFRHPERFGAASDLCNSALTPMSSLYRACTRGGLASPKKLLIAAKVLRGFAQLENPRASIRTVARGLGYCGGRGFGDHSVVATSYSPTELRGVSERELIPRLAKFVLRDTAFGGLCARPSQPRQRVEKKRSVR
jgi:hypothetical protein